MWFANRDEWRDVARYVSAVEDGEKGVLVPEPIWSGRSRRDTIRFACMYAALKSPITAAGGVLGITIMVGQLIWHCYRIFF